MPKSFQNSSIELSKDIKNPYIVFLHPIDKSHLSYFFIKLESAVP